jgi:endoglucanase
MKAQVLIFIVTTFLSTHSFCQSTSLRVDEKSNALTKDQGAIIRGDKNKKTIFLVFTGDEFADGLATITQTLKKENIKAGFFFTGRLYDNKDLHPVINQLKADGHYLGPHSDQHLLYNAWKSRDSLLVTRDSFLLDLKTNYQKMEALGIRESVKFFIPPFEWWNNAIASWCYEESIQLVSFTPGTFTNADYTYPELGKSYKSSDVILQRLFEKERTDGLNGCIVLVHVGTDPRRNDKLYDRLVEIVSELKRKGYSFGRVDEI